MNSHAPTALQRRTEIVALVRARTVRSQDELQRLLAARGIDVTQPTLSRDIKGLSLVKSAAGYGLPEANGAGGVAASPSASGASAGVSRRDRLLREHAVSVDRAGTLVVVKTPPGAANALALALDQDPPAGVVGTIAGDDTIFLAVRGAGAAARVVRVLTAPLGSVASRRAASRRAPASPRRPRRP